MIPVTAANLHDARRAGWQRHRFVGLLDLRHENRWLFGWPQDADHPSGRVSGLGIRPEVCPCFSRIKCSESSNVFTFLAAFLYRRFSVCALVRASMTIALALASASTVMALASPCAFKIDARCLNKGSANMATQAATAIPTPKATSVLLVARKAIPAVHHPGPSDLPRRRLMALAACGDEWGAVAVTTTARHVGRVAGRK